jgi:dTDP-4-dehydrorhamnose reductase
MNNKLFFALLIACASSQLHAETILIFGGEKGWIGQKLVALFRQAGHNAVPAKSRLENREDIVAEIKTVKPDAIINAAGIIGKPNVDWCETHKQETIRVNVIGTINLADIAYQHNLHLTNISTGCIYEYDAQHPMWSGIGFTEEEAPNFDGSFYSATKILMEKLILNYPNVLNLRVKMPLSTDMDHGFVAKIIKYEKVVNIPNSLCILDDMLPLAVDMTLRRLTGNYNFVNPGALSHNQVLELYKKYIDPSFTWKNFSIEEHNQILKARRANAELSAAKLLKLYPELPPIKEALINLFKKIAAQNQK